VTVKGKCIRIYPCKITVHLKVYYTLGEFKSIGQENSLKKFKNLPIIHVKNSKLVKINKKEKNILDKIGKKYHNYHCKMLPDKSCIRRRRVGSGNCLPVL
jgi:hypothetical protein